MTTPSLTFFEQKKILLTGGAGFIGSHLAERLLNLGATVLAVDNLITGQKENVSNFISNPNFTLIKADASQPPEQYLPEGFTPDVILHFASPASPPQYQAHPVETYLVNSIGTHNLLQYLLQANPNGRFLFASTSEVYGDPAVHPQTENYWGNVNPNGIRSCYDEAKRLGETICGVHQRDLGMDVRIVRIFNTYGPKIDLADGRVIPDFIKNVLNNAPLTLFGDGSQTRSFCYVDDLVEGILRMAAAENTNGQTVNLGNPSEFTILEAAKVLEKIVAHPLEMKFAPLPKDDPTRRKPDITKAKELLNWEPAISFEDGLRRTLESFRSQ
jgi:nucleoside-diphosphate-sugar epimerase